MRYLYSYLATHLPSRRRGVAKLLILAALVLASRNPAWAQAPNWTFATNGSDPVGTGSSVTQATATDATGNVYVTGYFDGQLKFGSTVLTSRGSEDIFLAKYVPATGTWAWAQSAGGTADDYGYGLAVSGNSVYLTGNITNDLANTNKVLFGGTTTQLGATSNSSFDVVLAKYTDLGTSVVLTWTQVAGGLNSDVAKSIAVNGTNIYLTGYLTNDLANDYAVVFGGAGSAVGTVPLAGASTVLVFDLFVAKYTDKGSTAAIGWVAVGGGTGSDVGQGVAVSGTSVYVTGYINNTNTNANKVTFGGVGLVPGTAPQSGANSTAGQDIVVAKYTDNGTTSTLGWTQVAGGAGTDAGLGIAARGTSVYITGSITDDSHDTNDVAFGGSGLVAGRLGQAGASSTSSRDLVLAKYYDNGTSAVVAWTQVAGGTLTDGGSAIAVNGYDIYVAGFLTNTLVDGCQALFGGSGYTPGTLSRPGATNNLGTDVVVAKYYDNGPTATVNWAQVGGGNSGDAGYCVATTGSAVYVGGYIGPPATFGNITFTPSSSYYKNFVAGFGTPVLATAATAPATALRLLPNPATGTATLQGTAPGATVRVLDILGRAVLATTADATGTATLALPAGLTAGMYLVRAGSHTLRLAVQ